MVGHALDAAQDKHQHQLVIPAHAAGGTSFGEFLNEAFIVPVHQVIESLEPGPGDALVVCNADGSMAGIGLRQGGNQLQPKVVFDASG